MPRGGRSGLTLIELMVVMLVLAILGTIGIGIAQYALAQANQSGCGNNLRNLYGASRQYETRFNLYPTYRGSLFWKVLYVAEEGYDRNLEHYLCPATADTNRDTTGVPIWAVGDYTVPQPYEVSYGGPSSAAGKFKDVDVLAADDDEPSDAANHVAGMNVLFVNGRIIFYENPDGGPPLRIGVAPSNADVRNIKDLVN